MELKAIRTIRIQNPKLTRKECRLKAESFINVLEKSYPGGCDNTDTYFVMPGCEHISRHQPVAVFVAGDSETQGSWVLSTEDQFLLPEKD